LSAYRQEQCKAIVEGGGASGYMSLSLELPAMIELRTYYKFVRTCSKENTNNVLGNNSI